MHLNQYLELVKEFSGQCFGCTNQDKYIATINQWRVSSLWSGPRIQLDTKGVCYGLMQLFYKHVMYSSNPSEAVIDFSKKLDEFDQEIAKKVSFLQSIDSSEYSNNSKNQLSKSLGLDFIEMKRYSPFGNKILDEITKKINASNLLKKN